MRRFVIAAAVIEGLGFFALAIWAAGQQPPFDMSGFIFFFIVCVLPALGLGLWGRWLPLAAVLIGIDAFIALSVFVAGKISNH